MVYLNTGLLEADNGAVQTVSRLGVGSFIFNISYYLPESALHTIHSSVPIKPLLTWKYVKAIKVSMSKINLQKSFSPHDE